MPDDGVLSHHDKAARQDAGVLMTPISHRFLGESLLGERALKAEVPSKFKRAETTQGLKTERNFVGMHLKKRNGRNSAQQVISSRGPMYRAKQNLLCWRALLIGAIISFLVLTLANRVLHISTSGVPSVRSNTLNSKIQHRDIVAYGWPTPATRFALLQPSAVSRIIFAPEPFLAKHPEFSRYNRPPPGPLKTMV
jgi:hypothetical protein